MFSLETTVLLVLGGLYLVDCATLVERGQALLERKPGRWSLAFGNRYYVIRTKPVAMLNPLTPCVPTLRTAPLLGGTSAREIRPSTAARRLLPLRLLATIQFLLVLMVVPLTMIFFVGWPFLVAVIVAYLNTLAMLVILIRAFRVADVPWRSLWQLVFNAIVCLPLSINLYRRSSMLLPLAYDASRCLNLVPALERRHAAEVLQMHIQDLLEEEDEESQNAVALRVLWEKIVKEHRHGRL